MNKNVLKQGLVLCLSIVVILSLCTTAFAEGIETVKASQTNACEKTEGCVLERGHDGDCSMVPSETEETEQSAAAEEPEEGDSVQFSEDNAAGSDKGTENNLDNQARASDEYANVESEGITYRVRLNSEEKTADVFKVISVPEGATDISIPQAVTCDGVDYTVTRISLTLFHKQYADVAELTLPDTLTDVSGSFRAFPSLTKITIPGSVKTFSGSFQHMQKLETITFEEGVEEIDSSMMVSGCSALKNINLPRSLKAISNTGTFSAAEALEAVVLPEGVQIKEGCLFENDTALKYVELPASITEIKYNMFAGCTLLEKVTAAGTITSVEDKAFEGAGKLKEIPDLGKAESIGKSSFYNCRSLRRIPDLKNVTSMGSRAFQGCFLLYGSGEVDLSSLNEIPDYAFCGGVFIKSVKLSENLTSIGEEAFKNATFDTITFPETLTSIGSKAFYNTLKLSGTVTIPDSVTEIGDYAFQKAFSKASVADNKIIIGSGVREINANVFENANVSEIIFNNSKDDVNITGILPESIKVTYLIESIEDSVGDKISDEKNAPTLQEAVTAAAEAEGGGTVKLEKHIKLGKTVTVPAGKTVTILAESPSTIAGMEAQGLKELFKVEEGASVVFGRNIILSGRYNDGSVIMNCGTTELQMGTVVTGSVLERESTGVINSEGENAKFILDGGVIEKNILKGNASYSGIVRVSDGASTEIRSGFIQNNVSLSADSLNSSSGLLLKGKSSGIMIGGTIQKNQGCRGSAVMLFGNNDSEPTEFTLEDGEILENKCISIGSVEASGAVHVESNAGFTMNGGSIAKNKGVKGAGVCVVDGNLQSGASEYGTAFIMNGGSINENTGQTGGGIYSYSNGVTICKGEIKNNTASGNGGGIYSEGNETYHSTLKMTNALITGNTARQGGGMWFCATGRANVYVTNGAAVFGNTAADESTNRAAGDDFVFGAFSNNTEYLATLSDRMLGGGAVDWYKDGSVNIAPLGGSVYPVTDKNYPRYEDDTNKEQVQGGLKDHDSCIALKAILPFAEAKALAEKSAEVLITGNKAERGGGIGANGGIQIGTEGTTQVQVKKEWKGDSADQRPESVTVNLFNGSTMIDAAVLNAKNHWTHTFDGLPQNGNYTVAEEPVENYTAVVSGNAKDGFTITNTRNEGDKPITPSNPLSPAKVTLQARKLMDGKIPQGEQFTFLLKDDKGNLLQTKTAVDGAIVFDALTFNKEGEYSYTVSEQPGGNKKIDYDCSVYEILVTVKLNKVSNTFTAAVTVKKDGKEYTDSILFLNKTEEFVPSDKPDDPDNPNKPLPPDNPFNPNKPLPPDNPLEPGASKNDGTQTDTPKTGDEAPLMVLAGVLLASAGVLGGIYIRRRKIG